MSALTVASAAVASRPSRRWVLTRGAAGGAAALLGGVAAACGGGPSPSGTSGSSTPRTWTVGALSVPAGGAVVLGYRGPTPVWVTSPAAGRFVALSGVCTHASCPVQFEAATRELACPCHGSRFDAFTGAVLQGPAGSPLPRIPLVRHGDQLVVGPVPPAVSSAP
jgi:nitrite reductase/ring-hydroxylating ferredoxin subunit